MMNRSASLLGFLGLSLLAGCTINGQPADSSSSSPAQDEQVDESAVAGANQNDRSASRDGDELLTGAMVVSPSGRYIVMQRNTVTLIYDTTAKSYRELATPLLRVAFAKTSDTVFAFAADGTLAALDLATLDAKWSTEGGASCSLLRISDDDGALLFGDGQSVRVVDAASGAFRGASAASTGGAAYAAFVPGAQRALVVGHTVWRDGGPHTPVSDIDLTGARAAASVDVPNCEAQVAITPDGARAFLSPTYCSPGAQAVPGQTWTNPDPVSVIELGASGPSFHENLPGFGPVVMSKDGAEVVAYLDVKRMDPSMFSDPKQVPWKDGQRYYLMTIDARSLAFRLAPIGNAIPRFAMTADGRGLLVDASKKFTSRTVIAARAEVTVGPDGVQASAELNLDVFGSSSAFGYFDLGSQSFTSFSGPSAPLDRFVQIAGGRYVLTLAKRADGLGGVPYMIDVATKQTWALDGNFGSGVRDVGLSADGSTTLLRLRLPANVHDSGYYSREGLSISIDGSFGGSLAATYEATVPFATVQVQSPVDECPGGHDCF
jgi:hypothetical protein